MADSSLPVEILEVIFENLILEYSKEVGKYVSLPRWYLLPLLRVCKLWHLVGERYLYRSISIGSSFSYRRIQKLAAPPTLVTRKPSFIAVELVRALKGNSRLATLVEELQMGSNTELWSATNTQLVDICPNLRHVDIRKIHSSELDSLFEALKKKALISFRISLLRNNERTSLPIFDLMEGWPKIQTIRVDGTYTLRQIGRADLQASGALNCCPELREIILDYGCIRKSDFASLRLMCSVVTKLIVRVDCYDTEALDTFCGCLHAWSPTLEWLSIHVGPEHMASTSHLPLSQALSSLTSLQELNINNFDLDVDTISSLPQLKRLSHTSTRSNSALDRLASLLEDPERFAALIDIVISSYNGHTVRGRKVTLRDVCERRSIALKM